MGFPPPANLEKKETTMTLPAYYLDPLAFGDVRAGVESIPSGEDSRLSMGAPWLTGLVISQGRDGLKGEILDLMLDEKPVGSWTIDLTLEGKVRVPEPAQNKRLKLDGKELLDVLEKVEGGYGVSIEQKIWRLSMALLIQASLERNEKQWRFETPLKRRITITLNQTKT